MVSKNESLMTVVANLRAKAQFVRERKEDLAAGTLKFGEDFLTGGEFAAKVYIQTGTAMVATIQASRRVLETPTLRTMSSRFISNVAEDIASRLNEASNLLEAASKEEAVSQAVGDVKKAWDTWQESIEAMRSAMMSRAHLKVVPSGCSLPDDVSPFEA